MIIPINFEDLSVGDEVQFTGNGRGRGGHYNVTVIVTKINRATFNGTEAPRSYGAGSRWRIHRNTPLYVFVPQQPVD